MAETTAFALVGRRPAEGWVDPFSPTHLLRLRENDRPSWILAPVPISEGPTTVDATVLVPTGPERILLDALLLVAVEVVADEQIRAQLGDAGVTWGEGFVDLAGREVPRELYEGAVRAAAAAHLAIAVLPTSTIIGQLGLLADNSLSHTLLTAPQQ